MKPVVSLLISLSIILLFSACSVKEESAKECIADTILEQKQPALRIEAQMPQEATLTHARDEGLWAMFSHEDYRIIQEIFPAADWDEALKHVSGRSSQELETILCGDFPYEEYRCSWLVAGETETELCQCTVLFDGSFYYAVSIHCPASLSKTYEAVFSELLAGVELVRV